jgi:hypothetical protein
MRLDTHLQPKPFGLAGPADAAGIWPAVLLLPMALLVGCGSSSSGGDGSGIGGDLGSGFELVQFGTLGGSLQNGAVWPINRPIEFVFNQAVDFSTVNSSSISLRTTDGVAALGEFFVKLSPTGQPLPEVIVFQPRCPTESDFSDAGLTPGGVAYELLVLGSDLAAGISVKNQAGQSLKNSQARFFTTPTGTQASEIFFDQVQGPPAVRVQNSAGTEPIFSYLETFESDGAGGLIAQQTPLVVGDNGQPELVLDVPINLLSDVTQDVSLVLEINQPISPSEENLSSSRIRLEYLDGAVWRTVPSAVVLEKNCSLSGARLRMDPIGILPQDSLLRLVLSSSFEDLIGQTNPLDANNFARLRTANLSNPGFTNPGNLADEVFIGFDEGVSSFEPEAPDFAEPPAEWADGRLTASFDFLGTGGPNGTFDWRVVAGTVATINTNLSVTLVGGPDFFPTDTQQVVNGVVNVRNLLVEPGATLRIVGTNVCRIFATEEVEILGTLDISGLDGPDVFQLSSPNLPKPGSTGIAGSGDGGVGSPATTGSDSKGGQGFGAFKAPGKGGFGGNTGYNSSSSEANRRPGGGGAGTFALRDASNNLVGGEKGKDGAANATDALLGTKPPRGGDPGPSPFSDPVLTNDFFGVRLNPDGSFLAGELTQPWAGSGGGGGGDAIQFGTFPQIPWNFNNEESGAGGASGGGNLQIFAIGDIIIAGAGRILSNGGRGGRGESTNGINNVGGGSGGGSGGHLILQTAGSLDLSLATGTPLRADGGLGGPGQGNTYGTGVNSGGNGGRGVIQVHVVNPATQIKLPTTVGASLATLSSPDAYTLIPSFGRFSKGRTDFVPLAGASLNPGTTLDRPLFKFDGIDQNETIEDPENPGEQIPNPDFGRVNTVAGKVPDLAPLLQGNPLSLDVANRSLVVDAGALLTDNSLPFSNDAYLRNTGLLRQAELTLVQGLNGGDFAVATATFDIDTEQLTLFLAPGGPALTGLTTAATFSLKPRFFRVLTNNQFDALPDSAAVKLRYQVVAADDQGNPDPSTVVIDWTSNLEELNAAQVTGGLDFLRMEFLFDLDAAESGLSASNPRPALDFNRLIFAF